MLILIIGLFLANAAMAAVLAILCLTAPEGWQDESGFHFGRDE